MRLQNTGLLIHDEERATQGFTLFSPLIQDQVYLLDMKGDVVHEWTVNGNAYGYAYSFLMETCWLQPSHLMQSKKIERGCATFWNWTGMVE